MVHDTDPVRITSVTRGDLAGRICDALIGIALGVFGYLFPSESVEALAAKMLSAYRNRANLAAMAERGRRFVLENLTYQRLVEIYAQEYRRVVPRAFG